MKLFTVTFSDASGIRTVLANSKDQADMAAAMFLQTYWHETFPDVDPIALQNWRIALEMLAGAGVSDTVAIQEHDVYF